MLKYKLIYSTLSIWFLLPALTHAASFDCSKAQTLVEKLVCTDEKLNRLDDAMAENYKYMMASDIGDGARQDLKSTQKQWIKARNNCSDYDCISDLYMKRIDEVCNYPVLSGVHPICKYSHDLSSDTKQTNTVSQSKKKTPVSSSYQSKTSNSGNPNEGNLSPEITEKINRNSQKIASLEFSKDELNSMVYIQTDLVNSSQPFISLKALLAVLFDLPELRKITVVSSGRSKGFTLKIPGAQSQGFLFRFDDGDAFITHFVNGDEAIHIDTANESYTTGVVLIQLVSTALN